MRQRFKHYLPLSASEFDHIWNTADVTLDANVLLDLYRYHKDTRESLLAALATFSGRLWLSHQAAEEFFRNRTTVIASARRDFGTAEEALRALEKALLAAVEKLRGLRLVPEDIHRTLSGALERPLEIARSSLKKSQSGHPDFLTADLVLEELIELFDGSVGPEPTEEEGERLNREGDDRKRKQIPPGYLDSSKAENSNGDFFLWSQVLQHAREIERPVILITSERKDDWWEKQDGRRIGPRRELLAEAASVARQRIVLYETEHFLTTAGERGHPVDEKAIEEIRKVGLHRSADGDDEDAPDQEAIAYDSLTKLAPGLLKSDEVIASLIASTDATDFNVETIVIDGVGDINLDDVSFSFESVFYLRGKPRAGVVDPTTIIVAEVEGTLHFRGRAWRIADYEVRGNVHYDEDAMEPVEGSV